MIQNTTTSTTPTTTATSTPTSVSVSVTSTTSGLVTTTSSQIPTSATTTESSGLTVGAKAGIGVGVAVGAIFSILAVLGFIFRRRFMSLFSVQTAPPPEYSIAGEGNKQTPFPEPPTELPVLPAELNADGRL